MAKGVELGVAYLTLAASTRGFVADIGKGLAQGEREAAKSGKAMGKAIKDGIESAKPVDTSKLTAKVEADQKRLAAVVAQNSRKQEEATDRVRIAHQRLKEAREKYASGSSQVLAAEARFRQAISKSQDVASQARAKHELYATEVSRSKAKLAEAERANRELARSMEKAAAEAAQAEKKFQGFGGAIRKSLAGAREQIRNSLKGAFKPAETEAKTAGNRAGSSFTSALKGSLAGMTAYFGAQEIFGSIADSINKAGALEQSIGAIDSVFKGSAQQMHAWAKTAATSVGLSQNSYNELATTLGSSLKNAGTPMEELAGKTNGLITLGADLASMYGGTTKDAIDAVSAALRGEMDPIERYGISLNDAALTTEGLAMGIEKVGGSFTTQQKQLIVQSLLMKQSADAQGNFNREQDTFAHKQQVAAAQWEDLRTAMGEKFLPIATQVMGWVSDTAIPALEKFSGVTSKIFKSVMETSGIWGPFAAGIGIVVGAFWAWNAVAVPLAAALTAIGWKVIAIVGIISLLVGAVIYAYKNFDWFRKAVDTSWAWIKKVIAGFVGWWKEVAWPAISDGLQWMGDKFTWLYKDVVKPVWGFISDVVKGFVGWLVNTAIPWVSDALKTLGGWFSWLNDNIIQPVWYGIRVAITAAVAIVMTILEGLWWLIKNTIGPVFMWLWKTISGVFNKVVEKSRNATLWFMEHFGPAMSKVIGGVVFVFRKLWEAVSNVFNWIWGKISRFVGWLWDTISPFLNRCLENWRHNFQFLWNKISQVFTWIWNKIQAFAKWFRDKILPYIKWGIELLKQAFHSLWTKVSTVWDWISSKISRAWNWVKNTVLSPAINWIKNTFGPAWDWLAGKIRNVWDWISGKISGSWRWIRDSVFKPMGRYLTVDLVGMFTRAKDGIGRVWDNLKQKVKEPVRFVIDTVINGGFIKNYNKIADKFNVNKLPEVSLPKGFATGGIIPGYARGGILPGYQSRKKDELLTPMRKGEGVLVPEAVQALGPSFIHGVNAAANGGGIRGAEQWTKKHGIAAGDGHAHAHSHSAGYGWAGSHYSTSATTPPSGTRGIWGSHQAAASRAGAMSFPDRNFMGVSTKKAAMAWMGRSALNVNTDGKGPSVSVGYGSAGPWGFNMGSSVQVNPSAPRNMVLSILMHEYGHALSLGHTNNGASLMHPAIAGVKSPSASDYAALRSAWGKPGEGVKTYNINGGDDGGFSFRDILQPLWDSTVGRLVNSSMDGLARMFPGNHFVGLGTAAVKKLVQGGFDFILGNGEDDGGSSGGGGDWTNTVKSALKRVGLPVRDDYVNAWKKQIQSESGGNPRAVQGGYTDINTITGDLAKGLVQVIGSTFRAHRDRSLPDDQFHPMANLVAAMNYAKARYGTSGMLGVIGHGHGYAKGGIVGDKPGLYDDGGLIKGKGLRLIDHQRSTPDYVLTEKQWNAIYQVANRQVQAPNQGGITIGEVHGLTPEDVAAEIMREQRKHRSLMAI